MVAAAGWGRRPPLPRVAAGLAVGQRPFDLAPGNPRVVEAHGGYSTNTCSLPHVATKKNPAPDSGPGAGSSRSGRGGAGSRRTTAPGAGPPPPPPAAWPARPVRPPPAGPAPPPPSRAPPPRVRPSPGPPSRGPDPAPPPAAIVAETPSAAPI